MKLAIIDAKKAKKGEMDLPAQFHEPFRPDIISRAIFSLQAAARQPYGTDPDAGMRASAKLSRRRRNYRGSYGKGISRVPRKILSRRGERMNWVGANAPGMVGGRRAHPPKASKVWEQKINERENRKAIRSAMSATVDRKIVEARGHKVPAEYPFIISSEFEQLARTQDVLAALLQLGFADELGRSERTKVRAGRAKMRGRRTKRALSLLIVTATPDAPIAASASNIPGVEIVEAKALNAELLAPGTHPGRATLFTEQAIKALKEQGLFLDKGKKPQAAKVNGQSAEQSETVGTPKVKAPSTPRAKSESKTTSTKPKAETKTAKTGTKKSKTGESE